MTTEPLFVHLSDKLSYICSCCFRMFFEHRFLNCLPKHVFRSAFPCYRGKKQSKTYEDLQKLSTSQLKAYDILLKGLYGSIDGTYARLTKSCVTSI